MTLSRLSLSLKNWKDRYFFLIPSCHKKRSLPERSAFFLVRKIGKLGPCQAVLLLSRITIGPILPPVRVSVCVSYILPEPRFLGLSRSRVHAIDVRGLPGIDHRTNYSRRTERKAKQARDVRGSNKVNGGLS